MQLMLYDSYFENKCVKAINHTSYKNIALTLKSSRTKRNAIKKLLYTILFKNILFFYMQILYNITLFTRNCNK